VEVSSFVLGELPLAPVRVLEIGCGEGELTSTLARAGHDVLGIDPDAPEGLLFRRSTIEELDEPGPFEAVVASRSLHHVEDLAVALDKVVAVLRESGVIVIDDFGWERLDAASADRVGLPVDDWREEHEHLHTSEAMLDELDKRFERRSFSWEPYLYREARHVLAPDEERRLIEEGQIQAIGFRYVGNR
jgi:2-polyprenyl-3-methyl-5-hydroxy-6-metoxy-1,4-benzoquinol methylase